MEIRALSSAIGGEVLGLDLAGGIDAEQFNVLHRAWLEHLVLVFRDQRIGEGDLVSFSRSFGTLDEAPNDRNGKKFVPGFPELLVISNLLENGRPLGGLGNAEAAWHTDMSYNPIPPKASALYSLEVPPSGGDTCFLNMYLAYEGLPDALRTQLSGLRLKHDSTHNSVSELRHGMDMPADLRSSPGAVHPIVRTHPDSGRKCLFLGRRQFAYVVDLPVDESEALLDRLWAHCDEPRYSWCHQWRVGDLVLWDNRCAMHRRDGFDPAARRHMLRSQIQGDRPY